MNNILSIKNLNKKYDNFELKNINIDIPKGVIVGFIGENGAGKTTTIKSILNLINIDSGTIKMFDMDYKLNEKEIKEKIGVVFFLVLYVICKALISPSNFAGSLI